MTELVTRRYRDRELVLVSRVLELDLVVFCIRVESCSWVPASANHLIIDFSCWFYDYWDEPKLLARSQKSELASLAGFPINTASLLARTTSVNCHTISALDVFVSMSSVSEADTSEDIADFLLRIRELGEKRDQEDEERTRELEADILQRRKERQSKRGTRIS